MLRTRAILQHCNIATANNALDWHDPGRYADHLGLADYALAHPTDLPRQARRVAEDIALALQASILLRGETPSVSEAFCHARLGAQRPLLFGSLPAGMDTSALVNRAAMTF